MRKSTRSLLILAVAAIALGAAVYAKLVRERGLAPQPVTSLDPASVTHLEIHCRSCTTRVFERVDGMWWMKQPHDAKASAEAVTRLLAIACSDGRVRRGQARTRSATDDGDCRRHAHRYRWGGSHR